MRLFIHEYICGSGTSGPGVPASLWTEGWAMLTALLEDFARLPGVTTATLLDAGHAASRAALRADEVELVGPGGERDGFHRRMGRADAVLVVAPEFGGLLEERTRWVEDAGVALLGSSSAAVRAAGDKRDLADHLARHGVPTPRCLDAPAAADFPVVCKPRDGAGSQATFLARDAAEWGRAREAARAEGWEGELITQPFVSGTAASVALFVAGGALHACPAALQRLSDDGRFRYAGGVVPLAPGLSARAQAVATRAAAAVPGLRGYVGVDVVLGEPAGGGGDHVIEINPRVTTSYAGLRRLARANLAGAILAAATGGAMPTLTWREGPVAFGPDGGACDEQITAPPAASPGPSATG